MMQQRARTGTRPVAATVAAVLACLVAPAAALAQNAYITNSRSGTVSVIATATNAVVGSPIQVGRSHQGSVLGRRPDRPESIACQDS